MNHQTIKNAVSSILEELDPNPHREGLIDTPERVAKAYDEMFKGYDIAQAPKMTKFLRDNPSSPGGLIIDKGYFYSFCEHHILPFFGPYYFGYIPKDYWVGASKIGRMVDYFSCKLQIAERLAEEIIEFFWGELNPAGAVLFMSGRHLCKEMRGLKKHDSPFGVLEARGILLTNEAGCKDEFLARIGVKL